MRRPSFSFAHLADAHVGAWARDPGIRDALRAAVLRALAVVDERECEFLLISGDLFHTPVPDPTEVAPVAAALRDLVRRGRRVYVIYGSHDYVAHRTSWLDVLAETGLFLRAAPEAVRTEGSRWTLPFLVDEPTGAAIAGISGRSHGLDRAYYASVDSEAFRAHDGFRIFQFHSAVEEYLPEGLREHVRGIRRADLPGGCDYYAGGHIHRSYRGEGPDGGLLVNPGAVFGTSVTDLENAVAGRTHPGVVIVDVDGGVPRAEFVETVDRSSLRIVDVQVGGLPAAAARAEIERSVRDVATPGVLLFPRVHGTLADGSLAGLGLGRPDGPSTGAASAVHWEVDTAPVGGDGELVAGTPDLVAIDAALEELLASPPTPYPEGLPALTPAAVRELLRALGEPISDGESRTDYEAARVDGALKILGIRRIAAE